MRFLKWNVQESSLYSSTVDKLHQNHDEMESTKIQETM
jgi:hypothetical protein